MKKTGLILILLSVVLVCLSSCAEKVQQFQQGKLMIADFEEADYGDREVSEDDEDEEFDGDEDDEQLEDWYRDIEASIRAAGKLTEEEFWK